MENILIYLGIAITVGLIAVHSKKKFGKINKFWTIGVAAYLVLSHGTMVGRFGTGGDDIAGGIGGFIAQLIGFVVYWLFTGRRSIIVDGAPVKQSATDCADKKA